MENGGEQKTDCGILKMIRKQLGTRLEWRRNAKFEKGRPAAFSLMYDEWRTQWLVDLVTARILPVYYNLFLASKGESQNGRK
jgi:hypothetical protein